MNKLIIKIFVFILTVSASLAQYEFVPTTNPVYHFLMNQEVKGYLPNFSTNDLPWQTLEVVEALEIIDKHHNELSSFEQIALQNFKKEFNLIGDKNYVVFYSDSDSNQFFFDGFLGDGDKHIYYYKDPEDNISIKPLGNLDFTYIDSDTGKGFSLMGNLGIRMHGSIANHVGYYLQVTNGTVLMGEKWPALYDNKLQMNIKFAELNSDFDFTQSHVSLTYDWFTAVIGRQTRYMGSGINQKVFIADLSPPIDGLTLSATFSNFKYSFSTFSLLGIPDTTNIDVGYTTSIPTKLSSMHRFALRPSWGEIAFWEGVIYSGRGFDLSYLNPLSFFKSLEHANRDRDNSIMGLDAAIRPFNGMQIYGSFLLDDIIFDELGTDYWSNKFAYNLGLGYSSKIGFIGAEYSRVEPYTFSHFNPQNSYTNDQLLLGSFMYPNSDMVSLLYRFYWLGNRYPWIIRLAYERHGENIYDESGTLVKNVGSDPLQSRRSEDGYYAPFLDGNRINSAVIELNFAYEITRNFNIAVLAFFKMQENGHSYNNFRVKFSFEDF